MSPAPVDEIRSVSPSALTGDERARWTDLVATEPAFANPFLHPGFVDAVARSRGSGVEVAVLERGREAVGFFAFQREGSGRRAVPAGGTMADVQAWVTEPDVAWNAETVLEACGLDVVEYDHLLADQAARAGGCAYVDDAPTIDLSAGFEAYRERIEAGGSSVFRQIDRKRRKLTREVGPIEVELQATDAGILETGLGWQRRRVRAMGFVDMLAEPWVAALVGDVCAARIPGFEGAVSVLTAGGRPAAVHLGVLGDRVLASWIPTFDPDLGAYSPGSILQVEVCRLAAERGVDRVDLGRGENRLKDRLSTGAVRLAVGAVDRRPLHRLARSGRSWLRGVVVASPLGDALRTGLRRLRARRAEG